MNSGLPLRIDLDGHSIDVGSQHGTFVNGRRVDQFQLRHPTGDGRPRQGGLAINNAAEIIGVPSAFFAERGVPIVSGRIRPINVIADLISQVKP